MNISLLVVEDEALIAQTLRLTLEGLGYDVLATCFTYAEAAEAFLAYKPDLVLLDINLGHEYPGRDGLALAQILTTLSPPVPFIFLTAYNDLDTIRRATRLAPSGYLIKPVNAAMLFAAIQAAIESHLTRQPPLLPTSPADLQTRAASPYFFVKVADTAHKLYWTQIATLEAGKNYVTLREASTGRTFALRGSLTQLLDQFVPEPVRDAFIRVNRRVCVNAAHVTRFDDDAVACAGEVFEVNTPTGLRQLQEMAFPKNAGG